MYNECMSFVGEKENKKGRARRILLRAILTLLWFLAAAFIIYNGTSSGEASSEQSSGVTDFVQKIVGVFAPDSWIANAEGEAYAKLHSAVRIAAHFLQYALLGALSVWCYLAYSRQPHGAVAPFCIAFYFPMVDEFLQGQTAGRAAEFSDVLVDIFGGFAGGMFAFIVFFAILLIRKRKAVKRIP